MKKDKLLSVLLSVLVIFSIIFTVKIWISEELWSDDRNFFDYKENFMSCLPFSEKNTEEATAAAPQHETVFMPVSVTVNIPGSGSSVYSGENDVCFSELNSLSKKILSEVFNQNEGGSAVSGQEYFDTLKSRSVLIKYPVSLPVKLIGHLCGIGNSSVFNDINDIKDLAVIPDSSSENSLLVYLHSSEKNKILKYKIFDCRNIFDDAVSEYGKNGNSLISAYELGFLKSDIGVEQKIVFNPLVFIDTSGKKPRTEIITGKTPFDKTEPSELDIEKANKIAASFGYNPNSVRRYTDHDGTLVFVENYCTIKLYKNGMLEYTTTNSEKGLNMQTNSNIPDNPQNLLYAVDCVCEILGNVWDILSPGEQPDIRLSYISAKDYSNYTLRFDFRYNGIPVTINSGNIQHAVETEIKNNHLFSLKVYIRNYTETGSYIENPAFLEAIDSIIGKIPDNTEAEDLFLGYIDYGTNGKICTRWNISSEKGETLSVGR